MTQGPLLSGFKELDKALERLDKKVERRLLMRVAKETMTPVVDSAKSLVPVDSGDLRDSIVMQASNLTKRARQQDRARPKQGVRIYVGSADRNAVIQEFGAPARNVPPQPYLRPAWDMNEAKLLPTAAKGLWEAIEKEARRAPKGKK